MQKVKISKKTGGVMGTATAIAVAAGIAVGTSGSVMPYKIEKVSDYVETLTIDVPQKYDLCELYLGDEMIDKALAPDVSFDATPIVYSDLSNLSVKLYNKGKCEHIAEFKGGKLR